MKMYLVPRLEFYLNQPELEIVEKVSNETNSVLSNLNDDSQSDNNMFTIEQNEVQDRLTDILDHLENFLNFDCLMTKMTIFKSFLFVNKTELITKNLSQIMTYLAVRDIRKLSKRGYSYSLKIKQKYQNKENINFDWFGKFESQKIIRCFEFLLGLNEILQQDSDQSESLFDSYSEFLKINFADSQYMKLLKLKAISTLRNNKNIWVFEREFNKVLFYFNNNGVWDSSENENKNDQTQIGFINENFNLHPILKGYCYEKKMTIEKKKVSDLGNMILMNRIIKITVNRCYFKP
jgi:hypothetical protein